MSNLERIGALHPKVVLYINNQPIWTAGTALDVQQLIAANGNHWRKTLTILAKLCANGDWREYRDRELLHSREQINFSDKLVANAKIHIFAGKSCWQRFAVSEEQLACMQQTACKKVFYCTSKEQGLMLYTAYFDYRQFPNVLIEEVKLLIESSNC